ncbi:unnamed protein product, partial [Bubo scandiacus]
PGAAIVFALPPAAGYPLPPAGRGAGSAGLPRPPRTAPDTGAAGEGGLAAGIPPRAQEAPRGGRDPAHTAGAHAVPAGQSPGVSGWIPGP